MRFAEPDAVYRVDTLPNDPLFGQLWGLNNTGQTVKSSTGTADADIDAPEAWSTTTGSSSVVVAVIDSGVDWHHPDLAANIWTNPGESCPGCASDGIDNDGNGYVDDVHGWDFVNDDNDPFDDHGHGTHVAGTIGASGSNGVGIAGVNWNVQIMPLKFIGANGQGTADDAVRAILYATRMGAVASNNSWGGEEFSQALEDAIADADAHGSLFVAAAGNSGKNTDTTPDYPSGFDLPNVITVGATDQNDVRAWFSNYGKQSVDLAAPGTNIYSTWPGGIYRFSEGTSMAAPHVTGVAALAKAAFPFASAVGLKALILRTVDQNASFAGLSTTGGRLNARAAVTCGSGAQVWIESPAPGFEVDVGKPVSVAVLGAACGDPAGAAVGLTANGSEVELAPRGDGLYTGSFTPTAAGAVQLVATTTAAGVSDTRTVSGTATSAPAIVPGGDPVTVTTTSPGEDARLVFEGAAGQRISLKLSDVTIGTSCCSSAKISILKPDGSTLLSASSFGTSGGFIDTKTLPQTGSYRILVDPQSNAVGSVTLTLYDVPEDAEVAGRPRRRARLGRDDRPRPERRLPLRRSRRRPREPQALRRHDRNLLLLLGEDLDPEAGRLHAPLRLELRHERRLHRHEDAPADGRLPHPRRSAVQRRRLGHADPLRRARTHPRRSAVQRRRLGHADPLRRARRSHRDARPRRCRIDACTRRARPERLENVLRDGRANGHAPPHGRDDRDLVLQLGQGVRAPARRHHPRLAGELRDEREDALVLAAHHRRLLDLRRPAVQRGRQRHALGELGRVSPHVRARDGARTRAAEEAQGELDLRAQELQHPADAVLSVDGEPPEGGPADQHRLGAERERRDDVRPPAHSRRP